MKTKQVFENFLMGIHAKEHIGTKETLVDSFDDWLMELEIDDFILYADEALNEQKREIEKTIEEAITTIEFDGGGAEVIYPSKVLKKIKEL